MQPGAAPAVTILRTVEARTADFHLVWLSINKPTKSIPMTSIQQWQCPFQFKQSQFSEAEKCKTQLSCSLWGPLLPFYDFPTLAAQLLVPPPSSLTSHNCQVLQLIWSLRANLFLFLQKRLLTLLRFTEPTVQPWELCAAFQSNWDFLASLC